MKQNILNMFKKRKNSMNIFYDSNYSVKLEQKSLEITGRNAQVFIVLGKETFTNKQYKELKKNITSQLRIAGLYSRKDEKKPSAPKKYTRKMLCYALTLLLHHDRISETDVISLEADPSPNNNLINKVYIPMGFELVAETGESITGGLMKSTVQEILDWCRETSF